MIIICKICHCEFEWTRKPGQRGGRVPTICLSAECRKERDHRCYLKWKANHSYTRYEKKKKKKQPDYESKNIPESKIKRYCIWPGCNRQTANNGQNRFYCQHHWTMLSDDIAGDDYLFVDGGENLIERFSKSVR